MNNKNDCSSHTEVIWTIERLCSIYASSRVTLPSTSPFLEAYSLTARYLSLPQFYANSVLQNMYAPPINL